MKILLIVVLLIHGVLHLMGFLKSFGFRDIPELTQPISKLSGLLWLVAFLLFLVSAIFLYTHQPLWPFFTISAILLSQVLIIMVWKDAKFGTLLNTLLILVAVPALGHYYFNRMVADEMMMLSDTSVVREINYLEKDSIVNLPPIVQKWLQNSGVVGKPMISLIHLYQRGELKTSTSGDWMPFTAEQWFSATSPSFVWKTQVSLMGPVSFSGRDKLVEGHGSMLIKLGSVIPVVNAKDNPKLDQATLLRFMAEICWFPTAATEPYFKWEPAGDLAAKATIETKDLEVSGIFTFNENGELLSFEAERYMGTGDEARLEKWLVENKAYKRFHGIKIPSKSEVSWKLEEGDHTWLRLEITDIRYNEPIAQ
jgi:hypothetical protein